MVLLLRNTALADIFRQFIKYGYEQFRNNNTSTVLAHP
jgi:hypothetical protein